VSPLPAIKSLQDELDGDYFDTAFNEGLIHQAVVTHEANQRADLAQAKNRSEVAGANQKPWRQKGTGRSRHGSRISPLWVGGGQAHAPDGTQDHSKELTNKMKKTALSSALTVRKEENSLHKLESVDLDEPSTSSMDDFFEDEDLAEQKLLLLHDSDEDFLRLSVRNLPYCEPVEVGSFSTYHVVANDLVIFTDDALDQFQERVAN
jgi:large subunit ribosomal protein L4